MEKGLPFKPQFLRKTTRTHPEANSSSGLETSSELRLANKIQATKATDDNKTQLTNCKGQLKRMSVIVHLADADECRVNVRTAALGGAVE